EMQEAAACAAASSSVWCPGEDSNLHTLRHTDLNRARLPIPPPGQVAWRGEIRAVAGSVNGLFQPFCATCCALARAAAARYHGAQPKAGMTRGPTDVETRHHLWRIGLCRAPDRLGAGPPGLAGARRRAPPQRGAVRA